MQGDQLCQAASCFSRQLRLPRCSADDCSRSRFSFHLSHQTQIICTDKCMLLPFPFGCGSPQGYIYWAPLRSYTENVFHRFFTARRQVSHKRHDKQTYIDSSHAVSSLLDMSSHTASLITMLDVRRGVCSSTHMNSSKT
jgi:hypothetical protein